VSTGIGPKDLILRPGQPVTRFKVFISSGNELRPQRDLFEKMVAVTNEQFRIREDSSRPFELVVDRWEQDAPRRTTDMNEEFVRRACDAHATVVLLATELRPGTQEEIEAVLERPDVQLSVIWMECETSQRKRRTLRSFLRAHQHEFAYDRVSGPETEEGFLALMRVITAVLADITRADRKEELYGEYRDAT
jgi:hypothetical protein